MEGRGSYYQEAGALRDMIQNHLLQIMATIAMEPSATFQPDAVRDERAKLLRSIRVLKSSEVLENSVSGQYGPARIGGADVPGFRQEEGVDPQSQTDTYAAATFFVDNWRWAGVPFYIRTGKRLPKRVTEIAIQFNAAPHAVFGDNGDESTPNLLILRIQPEEGISLRFLSKRPGAGMKLRPVSMDFNYGSSFGERSPTAYETLLLDVMIGDATLYTRQDMVEASWAVVEPIMQKAISDRLAWRIGPELVKVFAYDREFAFDAHVVLSYSAEGRHFFAAHRDNGAPTTADRSFAVSLNLNDDFEGGELVFPEYSATRVSPPLGAAAVFSCSVLHEARPVTRGRRFVLTTFFRTKK